MNAHARTLVPETADEARAAVAHVSRPATWAEAAAAFDAVVSNWKSKEHLHDADALGRAPTADETAITNDAIDALIQAQNLVRDYVPKSADEFARKAKLLLTHPEWETLEVAGILKADAEKMALPPVGAVVGLRNGDAFHVNRSASDLDRAIAALEAFEPKYQKAGGAHNAAELALQGAEGCPIVAPDALKVTAPAIEMRLRDRIATVPAASYTYEDEAVINKSDELSSEQKTTMLAALAVWKADVATWAESSGYALLERQEADTDKAFQKALNRREKLAQAVLKAPVSSPADIRKKLFAYAAGFDAEAPHLIDWDERLRDALEAVVRDIDSIGAQKPTPLASVFAGLEREFDRLWAVERALDDPPVGTDEEALAADIATQVVADQIMATPATCMDDLRIKARVVSWCHCGEAINLDGRTRDERVRSTAVLFAEGLINELLAYSPTPASDNGLRRQRWDEKWETAASAYERMKAIEAAGDDEVAEAAANSEDYDAFNAVRYGVPPDFDALLDKCRLLNRRG